MYSTSAGRDWPLTSKGDALITEPPGHVSGIAGSPTNAMRSLASQGNQAQLVHGLHGVVSATMIAQD